MKILNMKHIDKIYHFSACFLAALWSWEFAAGLAIGKEFGDSRAKGNKWCWWDMLANFGGIVCGYSLRLLLELWK